ncbi:hypothetical protein HOH45_03740 [bacterium]|jgi:hypothetical protein|nr:hypothetical protein [bacterium]
MNLKKIISASGLEDLGLTNSPDKNLIRNSILELVSKMNDVIDTSYKTPSGKVNFIKDTLKRVPMALREKVVLYLKANQIMSPFLKTCEKIDTNTSYALYHDIISSLEEESCLDTRFRIFKATLKSLDPSYQYLQVCSILRTHPIASDLLIKIQEMDDNPVSQFSKDIIENLIKNPSSFFETLKEKTNTLPPALMTKIKSYLIEDEIIKKFLTLLQPTEKFTPDDPSAAYALPIIIGVILENGSRYVFQELTDGLRQVPENLYSQTLAYLRKDTHTEKFAGRAEQEKTSKVTSKERHSQRKILKQEHEIRTRKAEIGSKSKPVQSTPTINSSKRFYQPSTTNRQPKSTEKNNGFCVVS